MCRREGTVKRRESVVSRVGTPMSEADGSVVEGSPGGNSVTDGKEKAANLESRLKRLKTVYFGKGKKRNSFGGGNVLEKKRPDNV